MPGNLFVWGRGGCAGVSRRGPLGVSLAFSAPLELPGTGSLFARERARHAPRRR
ncbi:hypothetical protein ACFUIV_18390 [Streptomyces anulatus]|uniref:hypothetical protein n=1 Tax=Streptomyces anulatus TaxID=1892 RepID=UPI003642AB79